MRLKDKVTAITGSGRGIGRSIAVRLAAEGAAVGVLDVLPAESAQTVEMIVRAGGRAIALTAAIVCVLTLTGTFVHLATIAVIARMLMTAPTIRIRKAAAPSPTLKLL